MALFNSFLKNYNTSASNISREAISAIIIFKPCKLNENLWILCFFVLQKVANPLMLEGYGINNLA